MIENIAINNDDNDAFLVKLSYKNRYINHQI